MIGESVIDFSTDYERLIYDQRTHFVCVRGRGKKRVRQKCDTELDVLDFVTQFADNRTMVYAVNKIGSSAHICNL